MAIEKNNPELIDLEIEQGVEQEITSPMMDGDALMLDDGSAIVNPEEDTSEEVAFNANLADLIPDDELSALSNSLISVFIYPTLYILNCVIYGSSWTKKFSYT